MTKHFTIHSRNRNYVELIVRANIIGFHGREEK